MARDADCYLDAAAKLLATNAFSAVEYAQKIETVQDGGNINPVAVVNPGTFRVVDGVDPILLERHVLGTVVVAARHEQPRERQLTLDRLVAVVEDTLNGQPLADLAFAAWTLVRQGQYSDDDAIEARCILQLEFGYLMDPVGGYAGADDGTFD